MEFLLEVPTVLLHIIFLELSSAKLSIQLWILQSPVMAKTLLPFVCTVNFPFTYRAIDGPTATSTAKKYQVSYICDSSVESDYSATQSGFLYLFLSCLQF